jgi:3-dehydroquinate dehydratase-2
MVQNVVSAGNTRPKVLLLNGPNLNRLGKREPEIYGTTTLADIFQDLQVSFPEFEIVAFQSNIEGELINSIHDAENFLAIVFNPGAFTHYSYALYDALKSVKTPCIEVHISNVHTREPFRHRSVISPAAVGVIGGMGFYSYKLAFFYIRDIIFSKNI